MFLCNSSHKTWSAGNIRPAVCVTCTRVNLGIYFHYFVKSDRYVKLKLVFIKINYEF